MKTIMSRKQSQTRAGTARSRGVEWAVTMLLAACGTWACGTWVGNPGDDEAKFVGVHPVVTGIETAEGGALTTPVKNAAGASGSFTFTSIYLAMDRMELFRDGEGAADTGAVITGPFLVDIISGNITPPVSSFSVPPGSYAGVHLVPAPLSADMLASVEGLPELADGTALLITGTYTAEGPDAAGVPATIQVQVSDAVTIDAPLEAETGQDLALRIRFEAATWFDFSDAGSSDFGIFAGEPSIDAASGQSEAIDGFLDVISANFSASGSLKPEAQQPPAPAGPAPAADDGRQGFPQENGLGGHWEFDGTGNVTGAERGVLDASGHDNNGTVQPEGTAMPYVEGYIGGGILFDGIDDFITVGKPTSFGGTGAMTLMAWIKPLSNHTGVVIARSSSRTTPAAGYRLFTNYDDDDDDEGMRFSMGISVDGDEVININSELAYKADEWHFIAGVFEPSKAVRIYVDGELAGEQTEEIPAQQFIPEAIDVMIGKRNNAHRFHGVIDEVSAWDRALDAAEIKAVFERQRQD